MANPVPNTNDGSANRPPEAWQNVSADGALTLNKQSYLLTKATALAATLAAPTNPDMDGLPVLIVSETAAAHVITTPAVLNGTNNTMTFGGAIGDSCILIPRNGKWFTGPLVNVTVSTV
jgi:hypothetical protein